MLRNIFNITDKKELLSAGMGYYDFYCGHPSYPAESVRFLPDSPYVANVLRPKEMQDWKALSLEEKKTYKWIAME